MERFSGTRKTMLKWFQFLLNFQDGKRSAQFEQTLVVTDLGCDILTQRLDSDGAPYFETQDKEKLTS